MGSSVVAALASFPDLQRRVDSAFAHRRASTGERLITQGDSAAGWFVIECGSVEVVDEGHDPPLLLNVLGPGADFGAESGLRPGTTTNATVVAASDLEYLWMAPARLEELVADMPDLGEALEELEQHRMTANLLVSVGPFVDLSADQRRALAEVTQEIPVEEKTILVEEGQPGERCFVIAEGTAEVLVKRDEGYQRVAEVGPGTLIGEGALLTDSPRNASVRMLEPGRIISIARDDFLSVIAGDHKVGVDVVTLMRMRSRPKRRAGVEIHERSTHDGELVIVLKDPGRNAYYRMAEDGRFIWERLDGKMTLREIAIEYVREYGRFDPERIASAVQGLVDEGFATTPALRGDLEPAQRSSLTTASLGALRALSWTRAIRGVDEWFEVVHRRFGRWLLSRPAVAVLGAIALTGIVVSIARAPRSTDFLAAAGAGSVILLALIPANAIGAVFHEAAHGLTVKHFGRDVKAAGIGWYLVSPVAFVDTSDMWLEDRRKRALVSAAGPFMNLVLAAFGVFAAVATDSAFVAAIAWQFAFASYYIAVLNLNPLLEFDGYYILSDALDRPNLREDALRWIGSGLPAALRGRGSWKGHRVDLAYGVLALAYILATAFFVVVIYRVLLQDAVGAMVPAWLAGGLAWALAGGVSVLLILATSAQVRGLRAPSH